MRVSGCAEHALLPEACQPSGMLLGMRTCHLTRAPVSAPEDNRAASYLFFKVQRAELRWHGNGMRRSVPGYWAGCHCMIASVTFQ
jgi:hypothetical protein